MQWLINAAFAVSGIILYGNREVFHTDNRILASYLTAVGAALIILFALRSAAARAFLSSPPVKFLGDISYSFYLMHYPILMLVTSIIYPLSGSLLASWLAGFAASIVISTLTYRYVEIPCIGLGRRLSQLIDRSTSELPKGSPTHDDGQLTKTF